uniref:Putative secreted protein n=1 Tax=Ixodes ricinus TaxID=34613 RepID=A0A6B0UM18_IXORI
MQVALLPGQVPVGILLAAVSIVVRTVHCTEHPLHQGALDVVRLHQVVNELVVVLARAHRTAHGLSVASVPNSWPQAVGYEARQLGCAGIGNTCPTFVVAKARGPLIRGHCRFPRHPHR